MPTRRLLLCLLAALSVARGAYFGVNLAGAEFGSVFPGVFGRDYTYPGVDDLDYYKARGVTLVRLPFRWERVQPTPLSALDPAESARLEAVVREIERRGMLVVLDMHNYGGYHVDGVNQPLGSARAPVAAFRDVWTRLAALLRGYDCVWGYGLMNEPVYQVAGSWKTAAQAAIDGIRTQDAARRIFVCGEGWSGAHSWTAVNSALNTLSDPAGRLVFEAHQYLDNDSSGSYDQSYDGEGANAQTGVDRLRPFVDWCRTRGVAGFIGEIGVPDDDPRWIDALQNALAYLKANDIPCALWAGGPWWGRYPLSTEMRASHDEAPQLTALLSHADARPTRHWKRFVWYADAINPGAQSSYGYQYKSDSASLAVDFASAAAAQTGGYSGAAGVRLSYSAPAGGWAGLGMHIGGGVNLSGNFARDHVLSFQARGTAGSSLRVCLIATDGSASPRVASPALGSAWKKISLPLSRFVAPGLSGSQRIQRVAFEGLPTDGSAHVVDLDSIVVEKPDSAAPLVSVAVAGGIGAHRRDAEILLSADASDASGVDFVEFMLDGVRVAVDDAPPYAHALRIASAGPHRLSAIAHDNHGNPARAAPLALNVVDDPADYDAWTALYFDAAELADHARETDRWGALADPDADGRANLLEYVTGSSPADASPSTADLVLTRSENGFAIRYRRAKRLDRDQRSSLVVLGAPELAGPWTALPGPGSVAADLGDFELRDIPLPHPDSRFFVRLQAARDAP